MHDAAVAYAYATPLEQAQELADIQVVVVNIDSMNLYDVTFTATITSPGGTETVLTEIVDTLLSIDTISVQSTASNTSGEIQIIFDETYTPTEVGGLHCRVCCKHN